MPFDSLPGHDIRIPEQRLVVPPSKPVLPYTEYAKMIMDAVGGLTDELSPTGRARRAAQVAQLNYLKHFYETGGKHDPTAPYKIAEIMARTRRANAQADASRRKDIPASQTWVGKLKEIVHPEHPDRAGRGHSGTYSPLSQPTVLPADPGDLLRTLNLEGERKAEIPADAPKTSEAEPMELSPVNEDDYDRNLISDSETDTDLPPISEEAIA